MKKIVKFSFIVIIILTIIKAFTAVLRHKDDPTVSIALKWNVFSENVIFQYEEKEGYLIMFSDENSCYGEDLLSNVYEIPLLIYFLTLISILLYMRKNKH